MENKLIDLIKDGDEKGAIELLKKNRNLNINYEVDNTPIVFNVISKHMVELFKEVINYPNFKEEDHAFLCVSMLQYLMYSYYGEINTPDEDRVKKGVNPELTMVMIDTILAKDDYDFNFKDINNDTALNTACTMSELLWVVEALLAKENIEINVIDDIEFTALTSAIHSNNIEAIKALSKRSDLVVRDIDVEYSQRHSIKLEDYGLNVNSAANVKEVVEETIVEE